MAIKTTVTVRVDEEVKNQAEVILDEIGINVTTLFNACLKALVREKKVPFNLVGNDYDLRRIIRDKLEESQIVAADPLAKRYTHEDIFAPLREKYGYAVQD